MGEREMGVGGCGVRACIFFSACVWVRGVRVLPVACVKKKGGTLLRFVWTRRAPPGAQCDMEVDGMKTRQEKTKKTSFHTTLSRVPGTPFHALHARPVRLSDTPQRHPAPPHAQMHAVRCPVSSSRPSSSGAAAAAGRSRASAPTSRGGLRVYAGRQPMLVPRYVPEVDTLCPP